MHANYVIAHCANIGCEITNRAHVNTIYTVSYHIIR